VGNGDALSAVTSAALSHRRRWRGKKAVIDPARRWPIPGVPELDHRAAMKSRRLDAIQVVVFVLL
jgi:hypothetical protein